LIEYDGCLESELLIRLYGAGGDHKEPWCVRRWMRLPSLEVGKHLLAKAAAGVPEEDQRVAAPKIL
jgi:hypothetical protein